MCQLSLEIGRYTRYRFLNLRIAYLPTTSRSFHRKKTLHNTNSKSLEFGIVYLPIHERYFQPRLNWQTLNVQRLRGLFMVNSECIHIYIYKQ
jgi:hypothetical protein